MGLQVRRLTESGTKFEDDQILRKHDMIVNTIIVDGGNILSAGWDSKLVFWVCHVSLYSMDTETEGVSCRSVKKGEIMNIRRMWLLSHTLTPCVLQGATHISSAVRRAIL